MHETLVERLFQWIGDVARVEVVVSIEVGIGPPVEFAFALWLGLWRLAGYGAPAL